jgi:truncated hemoglobin YjbI
VGRIYMEGGDLMPLFMDTHRFEGEMPSDEEIANAHAADLAEQDRHGVRFLKYWVSKDAKVVHCLVEAPDADAAARVHVETAGIGPEEIYAVDERT